MDRKKKGIVKVLRLDHTAFHDYINRYIRCNLKLEYKSDDSYEDTYVTEVVIDFNRLLNGLEYSNAIPHPIVRRDVSLLFARLIEDKIQTMSLYDIKMDTFCWEARPSYVCKRNNIGEIMYTGGYSKKYLATLDEVNAEEKNTPAYANWNLNWKGSHLHSVHIINCVNYFPFVEFLLDPVRSKQMRNIVIEVYSRETLPIKSQYIQLLELFNNNYSVRFFELSWDKEAQDKVNLKNRNDLTAHQTAVDLLPHYKHRIANIIKINQKARQCYIDHILLLFLIKKYIGDHTLSKLDRNVVMVIIDYLQPSDFKNIHVVDNNK